MIETIIIDDAEMIRHRLKYIISSAEDITCLGDACNGEQGLELLQETQPNIAIVDFRLQKGPERFDLIYAIKTISQNTKIITLTNEFNYSLLLHIINSGVSGVLIKAGHDYIIQAIRTIYDGNTFLQPEFGFELIKTAENHIRFRDLNERQFNILNKTVNEGKSREIIADELDTSPKAISNELSRIKKILGTKTKAELITAYKNYTKD